MMSSGEMAESCFSGWLMPWIGMGTIVLVLMLLIYLIIKVVK